jgi:hypothetical protein
MVPGVDPFGVLGRRQRAHPFGQRPLRLLRLEIG